MSRLALAAWALMVGVAIVALTVVASLHEGVLTAAARLWADAWGRATLVDTYGAFAAVWLGILARERSLPRALGWLVGILLTGNLAISVYLLLALRRLPADASWREVFVAPRGAR